MLSDVTTETGDKEHMDLPVNPDNWLTQTSYLSIRWDIKYAWKFVVRFNSSDVNTGENITFLYYCPSTPPPCHRKELGLSDPHSQTGLRLQEKMSLYSVHISRWAFLERKNVRSHTYRCGQRGPALLQGVRHLQVTNSKWTVPWHTKWSRCSSRDPLSRTVLEIS